MNEVIKKNKSYTEFVKKSQVATNAIPQTSDDTDLRAIIREEQNEQLAEETDKKMRSCNLILKVSVLIYGYFNETMQCIKCLIENVLKVNVLIYGYFNDTMQCIKCLIDNELKVSILIYRYFNETVQCIKCLIENVLKVSVLIRIF